MLPADRKVIATDKAPKAIGPYSVAIQLGSLVFTAGQAGLDPVNNELVEGGIEAETRQVLTNLQNVLAASGSALENVVKTTVFLRDMKDFARMNAIYAEFFQDQFPGANDRPGSSLAEGCRGRDRLHRVRPVVRRRGLCPANWCSSSTTNRISSNWRGLYLERDGFHGKSAGDGRAELYESENLRPALAGVVPGGEWAWDWPLLVRS